MIDCPSQASIVAYLESRSDAHASSAVNSTPQTTSSANTNSSKQPASREGSVFNFVNELLIEKSPVPALLPSVNWLKTMKTTSVRITNRKRFSLVVKKGEGSFSLHVFIESSGMLVQDPNAKPRRANELVESILKKAATCVEISSQTMFYFVQRRTIP